MLHVEVTITGDREEIAKIKKLGDKLTDFSDAMRDMGKELKGYYGGTGGIPGQVFSSQGGVYGKKWAALSPVYKNRKLDKYRSSKILIATGNMMESFVAKSDKQSVTISNTATYFKYHQQGTRRMPARPMLLINTDVEEIAQNIINEDVHKKIETVMH